MKIANSEIVDVVCLVLPSGETLWIEQFKGESYLRKVIDKWKMEHPEFKDVRLTMGCVLISMPRDRFELVPVGSFVFPEL